MKFRKRNLDHKSFFSLGRYVNELIQIICFFERSSLKLRCKTVIGIVLCYRHQVCRLLYYNWAKLATAFTCTGLLLNLYTSVLWFRIWKKILADRRIWWKKGTDRRICIPLFTCLSYGACGKFGEHERSTRVAEAIAKGNSSFLSALLTSQVLHNSIVYS